jgi:Putative zinc-finger
MSEHRDLIQDPFEHDDAAYVLGALDERDRIAFEQHLRGCGACTERVRALRQMPVALGALARERAEQEFGDILTSQTPPPDTLLPRLLTEARRGRRRRRWFVTTLAAAAACLLVATVLLATLRSSPTSAPAGHPLAMQPVAASAIRATADVQSVGWGTRIQLKCTYNTTEYPAEGKYLLVVEDRNGQRDALGSWTPLPGRVTTFTAGTAIPTSQIRQVLITDPDGTVLQLTL